MEAELSDLMLKKFMKDIDGTPERIDEKSFNINFNCSEGNVQAQLLYQVNMFLNFFDIRLCLSHLSNTLQ